MTSAGCRITRSRVTSGPRPLPRQVSCIARSHLLLIFLLVDLSQAPDHRIKTKMELDLCHAQCLATCRELEDSLCDCTKWKDANNAQSDVTLWLADCPDPESFDCSGTCSEFQKQNETFPIRPEVWIYNDAANGLTILNWVTDAEPSTVFFVARVWPTQYGEIWATTIEVVNVSSLTFTNNKGPCFSPDLRVAAVSSAGIAGFSKPAKTIVSPPGQPRNISLTILDQDQTSLDNETILYTLMWRPDLGWSGDELKYEVKVDTKCMNKHLDQFYIINDNIEVAKDQTKEDLFVQTGRMFTYAIGCTFNFQLNLTHVCDQEINSDAAQFSYTLGCQDVHSYYTGEHCLPPPIVEPGPVRKVKVNALPLTDSQLVVVTWLPPENLGSAGYVSAYHVVWGLIRITPVGNSLDAFAQMYIADVLGNRTVPGTEFGTDIHVNKSDMPPNTDIGITVRAIGPNQVINNDVQGLVYKDANQWTAGHQQGTVVADDGTIVVLQYKKVSSDPLTWNRDPPALRTGTTFFNNDTTMSRRETPSFDDDTLSFEEETTLSFPQDATFNGSTHQIESLVRVTNDFLGVKTHKPLSGALLFWRRHMLGVNTTDVLGYRIQWGLTDSECISNQSIGGEFCDGQAFTTVTDEALCQQEFLPLYNLTTNMTYGLKIKPVHNLSFFDTDDTTWDDVVVHTFVLSDLPEPSDDPVTPGTSVMPSTSEAGVKGATSDDDQVDLTLVTIAVSCSAAVLLLCVLAVVFWLKRKRLKRSSLTYMGSPDDRNYSVFVPGKSLNSIPKGPIATDEWELPLTCLKFGPILGSGAFGKVVKGRISRAMLTHRGVASLLADYGACLQEGDTVHATVAIKLLQGDCEGVYRQDFLKEIQLMKKIGYHENIVSMLGCCTLRDPVCLVVEHVGQGDLLNYLKSIRHKLQALPSSRRQYVNSIIEIIDPLDLLRFAGHITRGMDFLASKGFVHRDLAARNVLVGNNKVCKIGDFGLARYVYDNVVYINRRGGRLPVKWMSEEAIFDLTFSTASDVWSFGIVLFEIVTLGGTPYPTIPTRNLLKELQKGYRMERPVNCSQEL
nr:ephrin type-A receptor 3-like [Biomphalaria glabrata]